MAGIGIRLRTIRQQWRLTLREVEERSQRFAQTQGNTAYQVSASWLDRLEREEHELTVNKLIALAEIYNLTPEQLLRAIYPAVTQPALLKQLSYPNATMLLEDGPLEQQAKYLLPDQPLADPFPEETTLLTPESVAAVAPYRRGYYWQTRPYPGSHDPGWLHRADRYPEARHLIAQRMEA